MVFNLGLTTNPNLRI